MVVDCDSCATFTLQSGTYMVYLHMPTHGGENYNLNKQIDNFDFWLEEYSTVDRGINNEPITLIGVEYDCDPHLCIPICIPICMGNEIINNIVHISYMMDKNEEVTISGLATCLDGIYIIKKFTVKSMRRPHAYSWNMVLEFVRD
jgi:hypothetical protein